MRELPLYRLTINEDDEDTGVSMVALVDEPAIEKKWMMFNNHEFKIGDTVSVVPGKEHDPKHKGVLMTIAEINNGAIALLMPDGKIHKWYTADELIKSENSIKNFLKFKIDSERKIISGAMMIPNLPIYRRDAATGEEYRVVFDRETIQSIAMKLMRRSNTNIVNVMHDGIAVEGAYLFEFLLIDHSRGIILDGFRDLIDGSLFGSIKVDNSDIWEQVKAGTYKGFSVEGNFKQTLINEIDDEVMKALAQIVLLN